jgi:hypothetical protein
MGITDAATVESGRVMILGDRYVVVEGRRIETDHERRWSRAYMFRDNWREYEEFPAELRTARVGRWVAKGPRKSNDSGVSEMVSGLSTWASQSKGSWSTQLPSRSFSRSGDRASSMFRTFRQRRVLNQGPPFRRSMPQRSIGFGRPTRASHTYWVTRSSPALSRPLTTHGAAVRNSLWTAASRVVHARASGEP